MTGAMRGHLVRDGTNPSPVDWRSPLSRNRADDFCRAVVASCPSCRSMCRWRGEL